MCRYSLITFDFVRRLDHCLTFRIRFSCFRKSSMPLNTHACASINRREAEYNARRSGYRREGSAELQHGDQRSAARDSRAAAGGQRGAGPVQRSVSPVRSWEGTRGRVSAREMLGGQGCIAAIHDQSLFRKLVSGGSHTILVANLEIVCG